MSIDRVATNSQSSYMLSQIMQAESALDTTQAQVASGKISTNYAGIGDKTAVLEATRSASERTTGYQAATTTALNQADQQDTQLTSLSDLAEQLRTAITTAIGNNDASTLMTTASGIFDQAEQILNSKDSNGNYLYGGDQNTQPPLTATSISDLTSVSSASQVFQNGTITNSVMVADGQTVNVGMLASNIGEQLMDTLKSVADLNASSTLGTDLTSTQTSSLQSAITSATNAETTINNAAASNGNVYNQLQDASDQQTAMSNMYTGFVSNLEDTDMSTALTTLNENQTALQAAVEVTAQLNQVSLLNYLPSSGT
jgi:flagellar hook-associated protein 3 FlgL